MIVFVKNKVNRKGVVYGRGLVNRLINSLPIELHLPGYQFCGPGTKLEKRLERGDKGVNGLDAACRIHDIEYSKSNDITQRHQADRQLAAKAWERVKAKDSTLGEKLSAYLVTNAMKAKTKFGLGMQNNNSKAMCGKKIFRAAVKNAMKNMRKEKPNDINTAIKIARRTISNSFKGKKAQVVIPRVIPIPKIGGFLPIIPIISALGALGAISSGASSIINTVKSIKNVKKQLEENVRHNKTMEAVAMGKGLYLKPYKRGMGIVYKSNKSTLKNY